MGKGKWRWGVILDAGSSGTRVYIYRWKDPARALKDADYGDLHSLPELKTKKDWTKKIRPGVSTFGDHPEDVGPDHLQHLIDHALDIIPEEKHADTPIFLMATAGMRLLPLNEQRAVTSEICSYFRQNTRFSLPDCAMHIQVIPGATEGLYGWIAANYLLGGFNDPNGHAHGKGHHTYGFLDMGGASAQIAFAPNTTVAEQHANDLQLLRMRTLNGAPLEYKLFTTTWLRFGMHEARHRYVERLLDTYLVEDGQHEVPDPCLPRGLRTTVDGEVIVGKSAKMELVGTGEFDDCLRMTKPLLGKDSVCHDDPCLLNGQHVPPIDFDVNHFVGVSEFWHTTHGVFSKDKESAYDFNTYQNEVLDFCNRSWEDIEDDINSEKREDAQEACFKASWLINVLHEGLGIPRVGLDSTPVPGYNTTKTIGEAAQDKGFLDPFQAADKIGGFEVSWTLGKMVLYASGQIPPQSNANLPVGFGSNVKGIPEDFQYAGSTYNTTLSYDDDDDDWTDTAEEFLDHAKSRSSSSFFMFILVLFFLAFLFRKRDRRMRLYTKINSILRPRRRQGSPRKGGRVFSSLASKLFGRGAYNYERVLEDGDFAQFELGEASSDDGDHSDGSGSSRVGRASGLATPKLNVESFDDAKKPGTPGSALDRSGLVVRTESRERLFPQMLHAGRRSRTGSPTRQKSSLMSPLSED
ncbi:Golgi apyrase [Diatrype stigma]|uniref:Golgi apyrase n=1 Tax=Diatrype stigma TaxID=117547 RepID=A0AAN9URS9_9PEZI